MDILPIKRDISATIHPQGHISPWMLPSLRVNHISHTLIFKGRLEERKINCQEFFLGMVRLVGVPQPVNVPNVSTSNTSSSPTVQDISAPEFSDSAPTLPIVPNVPALDSSKESTSEHKKFQHTPNEELIVEKLPTEIPANELEIQLREREYMLPENTSKLKVYLRKGKSTTSSHIPSSNPKSSNENTHSSVYNDLYLAHCIEERH